jgi:predicted aspartyl protease
MAVGAGPVQACELAMIAELKVELLGNKPMVSSEINGQKVLMMIDTGAVANTILAAQARRLGLKGVYIDNLRMVGVGGMSTASQATIADFKLGSIPVKDMEVLVAGEAQTLGHPDLAGVIGASVFSKFDVDFDLAAGTIRMLKPIDCKAAEVVYWDFDHTVAPMTPVDKDSPDFQTEVSLNGRKTKATLDTGATTSVVTLTAASAAGIGPRSPGVVPIGEAGGFGANTVEAWLARFDSFAIGDETIKNARLPIADLFQHSKVATTGSRVDRRVEGTPRMLLGADFFRSHRVLISNSQNRIYVAYKGGPVFAPPKPVAAPTSTP